MQKLFKTDEDTDDIIKATLGDICDFFTGMDITGAIHHRAQEENLDPIELEIENTQSSWVPANIANGGCNNDVEEEDGFSAVRRSLSREPHSFENYHGSPMYRTELARSDGTEHDVKQAFFDKLGLTPSAKAQPHCHEQEKDVVKIHVELSKRPVGGNDLRHWVKQVFHNLNKSVGPVDNKEIFCRASQCGKRVKKSEKIAYCHQFPFHEKCLTIIAGGTQVKCNMCIKKGCFICGNSNDSPVKCSKCELRYHIHCLKLFPQAEIQNETGPITCPAHFCHTCIAEQHVLKKVRAYEVEKPSFRCVKCPTSYHEACVPASCLPSRTGLGFITCPRHEDVQAPAGLRRLGCFMCSHPLDRKGKQVDCIKCPLSYHADCVPNQGETGGNRNMFVCRYCFWGLYPLPGDILWYQQPNYRFSLARVLFPCEDDNKNCERGFSVKILGAQPRILPGCSTSRVVSFSVGNGKFLKEIGIYKDTPRMRSICEEALHLATLFAIHRDSILNPPSPLYKKIESNAHRPVKPGAILMKTTRNDVPTLSRAQGCFSVEANAAFGQDPLSHANFQPHKEDSIGQQAVVALNDIPKQKREIEEGDQELSTLLRKEQRKRKIGEGEHVDGALEKPQAKRVSHPGPSVALRKNGSTLDGLKSQISGEEGGASNNVDPSTKAVRKNSNTGLLSCSHPGCPKCFYSQQDLLSHEEWHKLPELPAGRAKRGSIKRADKKFHCPFAFCGKIFASDSSYRGHFRRVHGEAVYCKTCKAKCTDGPTLKRHMNEQHNNSRKRVGKRRKSVKVNLLPNADEGKQ